MRFQLAASVLGMVSLIGASASALPLLHRHHRTYVIESPQPTYVAPPPAAPAPPPQVNVQVSPSYAPRGGGPDDLQNHQWQEQQQLREHQLQEQRQLQEHQMQEAAPQY